MNRRERYRLECYPEYPVKPPSFIVGAKDFPETIAHRFMITVGSKGGQ